MFARTLSILSLGLLLQQAAVAASLTVTIDAEFEVPEDGRLFVTVTRDADEEPRFYPGRPNSRDEALFGLDVHGWDGGTIDMGKAIGFPYASLNELPAGRWHVQALYDTNKILSDMNAPGNRYSVPAVLDWDGDGEARLALTLSREVPAETIPQDTDRVRYVKYRSELLSAFWNTDMYLRASIMLPDGYNLETAADLPVVFDVGGYGSRYTRVSRYAENEEFLAFWQDPETPPVVMVFLDGEAPFGDSYQIDSAVNGPYGEATWREFMPWLYGELGIAMNPDQRFITGCSTGGWVSLATQIFYPELFNGAWSFSADGVDFRQFQLINIYDDENALVNEYGLDRPSNRDADGEIVFTIRQEIYMERVMGRGDTFTTSGGQWGGWNAVYGELGPDGTPVPIWDTVTGEINHDTAEAWSKYDLTRYVTRNWQTLGPKIAGKLFIWMGDMDGYYLNNAMRLFQDAVVPLMENPERDARFTFLAETDHCDFDAIDMRKSVLGEMAERAAASRSTSSVPREKP
jgi:hypothetical protein